MAKHRLAINSIASKMADSGSEYYKTNIYSSSGDCTSHTSKVGQVRCFMTYGHKGVHKAFSGMSGNLHTWGSHRA